MAVVAVAVALLLLLVSLRYLLVLISQMLVRICWIPCSRLAHTTVVTTIPQTFLTCSTERKKLEWNV